MVLIYRTLNTVTTETKSHFFKPENSVVHSFDGSALIYRTQNSVLGR